MEFRKSDAPIHVLARGLVMAGEDIILCRVVGKSWFFLPGGHVESGETAREALIRELKEEMGDHEFKITRFLGVCEHHFQHDDNSIQQEINLVFQVEVNSDDIKTQEGHIEFVKLTRAEFSESKVLPLQLKDGLVDALSSSNPFYKDLVF